MGLWDDRRGQSMQIGAILLFGFLVLSLSSYQAFIVPQQNEKVEFQHSQEVQEDVQTLRNDLISTAKDSAFGDTVVELGTRYPTRLFAINPEPPSGTLRTTEARSITVTGNGGDFTDSICVGQGGGAETRFLQYRPSYNVYSNAPTSVYENTVLYNEYAEATMMETGQLLVNGNTVNLIPITGTYTASGTEAVNVEPRAGRRNEVSIADPVIVLPTRLSESHWEKLIGPIDGTIDVTGTGDDRELTLDLEGTYNVICIPVGINQQPPFPPEIAEFSVDDNSVCDPSGNCKDENKAEYRVSWDVSDQNNDHSVTVYVNDTTEGETVATFTRNSGTETITESDDSGNEYEIKLLGTDTNGNRVCEVVNDRADGTDGSPSSC